MNYIKYLSVTSHVSAGCQGTGFDGMRAGCLLSFLLSHLVSRVDWDSVREGSLFWKVLEREGETMGLAQKVLALPFATSVTVGRLLGLDFSVMVFHFG